uniref:Putative mitochondrial protein n=1 Tax=Tanacetum cinerariifolium TaxID=118510 RepID=A0A699IBW2_TANCI|nr:putative mitochondrial protein [Tanacetum cinerariifolium]
MVAIRSTYTNDLNIVLMTLNTVESELARIQTAMDQINEIIRGLLFLQQFETPYINSLSNGEALNWHKQFLKRRGDTVIRKLYETEIEERFDYVYEDPMVELKNLNQVTSVQVYQDLFEALLNKVEQPKAYAISLFIGGMKEEIKLVFKREEDECLNWSESLQTKRMEVPWLGRHINSTNVITVDQSGSHMNIM